DDLITRGVAEPYRMFTSRAEYRLSLREDNADLRLTEVGRELGLVDDIRWDAFNRKRDAIAAEVQRLKSTWMRPQQLPLGEAERVLGKPMEREYSLFDLLRRPEIGYQNLLTLPGAGEGMTDHQVIEQVDIQAKYQGYIDRQLDEVEKARASENLRLPPDMDFSEVHGLSIEVRQKLAQHKPETLGQASRIQGVTPAAISLLLVHLKRRTSGKAA
ncbi:MAG TPA: tRNA uridine-5-carboxymethylaminomethyl(34) synthesis enzyme MnmG, partial [Rhodocyclaceae bacterium]